MRPEPRYFSIPARVCGGNRRSDSALNCRPCSGSASHCPVASINSPAAARGVWPTTVTGPRCPSTCTRSTAKPVSGLWKVTRSIVPESCWVMLVFYARRPIRIRNIPRERESASATIKSLTIPPAPHHPHDAKAMSLTVQNLNKSYPTRSGELSVLRDVRLTLQDGEALAILGPSGSGKSTLLYL